MIVRTAIKIAKTMTPKEAKRRILNGTAPVGLHVQGHLNLSQLRDLTALPEGLSVARLTLRGCRRLTQLPARLHCFELDAANTGLTTLPDDLAVTNRIDLSGCADLRSLPEGLRVHRLVLKNCTRLETLPERLSVRFLDVSGCISLRIWPRLTAPQAGQRIAPDGSQITLPLEYPTERPEPDANRCADLAASPEG